MSGSQEGKTPSRNRRLIIAPFVLILIIGMMGFFRVADSPEFESYRTVHVIQLLTSGASIGVLLTALMFTLIRPRT